MNGCTVYNYILTVHSALRVQLVIYIHVNLYKMKADPGIGLKLSPRLATSPLFLTRAIMIWPCAKSFAVSRLLGTRQREHLPCAYKTAHGKDVGHGEDYICRVPTKKTHGNCDAHGKDPVFAVCRTSGTRQRCGTRYEMTWPFCLPCAALNTRQIKTFAVCI